MMRRVHSSQLSIYHDTRYPDAPCLSQTDPQMRERERERLVVQASARSRRSHLCGESLGSLRTYFSKILGSFGGFGSKFDRKLSRNETDPTASLTQCLSQQASQRNSPPSSGISSPSPFVSLWINFKTNGNVCSPGIHSRVPAWQEARRRSVLVSPFHF
jgi:hypothetical protein